jgi:hypothetical protein
VWRPEPHGPPGHRVFEVLIQDDNNAVAPINMVAWEEMKDVDLNEGDLVLVDGATVRVYNGAPQLQLNRTARMIAGMSTKQVVAFRKACEKYIDDGVAALRKALAVDKPGRAARPVNAADAAAFAARDEEEYSPPDDADAMEVVEQGAATSTYNTRKRVSKPPVEDEEQATTTSSSSRAPKEAKRR